MYEITNEKLLEAVAGGTDTPVDNGVTTEDETNGTTTRTTVFKNGNSIVVIIRPDGHGTVIATNVVDNPSVAAGNKAIGGEISGGQRIVVTVTPFLARGRDDIYGFIGR